jgi:hypothetical protein
VSSIETAAVVVTVGRVEVVAGRGSLAAQAEVVLGIGGVDITLLGVQVRRTPDYRLKVQAPQFRHARSGLLMPAVILDPEITDCVASELLAIFQDMQIDRPAGARGRAAGEMLAAREVVR